MKEEMKKLAMENAALGKVAALEETVWINPDFTPYEEAKMQMEITDQQIEDAAKRLSRFAPFIKKCFPETLDRDGIIESPLVKITSMQKRLMEEYHTSIPGELWLKEDSHLAIAGSIKARGGIYEVLKHAEDLALEHGIISLTDDYSQFSSEKIQSFLGQYTIQVGSTGNLGLSIGIMSAAIGFHVIVHMSADAKQWKKDLLRSKGVVVKEYASDYSKAVEEGRKASNANPNSYFVDDEKSVNLFLGYAVAAGRLKEQLEDNNIKISKEHPLIVYLPCGVGGAPGGVAYGLKKIFKDSVFCFFTEPTLSPCMLLGMATKLQEEVCVQDFGISGITHADGLAVGRPSGFVGSVMTPLLSGIFTVSDSKLYDYMRLLNSSEQIQIEPSACAAFCGPVHLMDYEDSKNLIEKQIGTNLENACQIAWATGGRLVPKVNMDEYLETYL